jgi:hypothetical protein
VDEDVYEYDDDEDLPGAERGSGLGVGARGADSEVDANDAKCEVDAVYETSSRSYDAYCEVDAVYETSIRITAAALCGCCLWGFSPSLGFFPVPPFPTLFPALLPFPFNPWESRNV